MWLVTGSASGLGRNIAGAVLASGDRLVATARDPDRLEDLVNWYKRILITQLAGEADTSGAFDLVVSKMRKGTEPPAHVHSREHAAAEIWKTARSDGRGEAFE